MKTCVAVHSEATESADMRGMMFATARATLFVCTVGCVLSCASDPLELTNEGREVVVPDRYRSCARDEDCMLVSIACDGCCQRGSVAKEFGDEYERDRRESCSRYRGPECDCMFLEMRALCEAERCRAAYFSIGSIFEHPSQRGRVLNARSQEPLRAAARASVCQ